MTTLRDKIFDRDRGVCALCQLDTGSLLEIGQQLMGEHRWLRSEWIHFLVAIEVDAGQSLDYWHVDHIIPKVEGGGNEMTNLRTLCVACHKDETRDLRARMRRIPYKVRDYKAKLRRMGIIR